MAKAYIRTCGTLLARAQVRALHRFSRSSELAWLALPPPYDPCAEEEEGKTSQRGATSFCVGKVLPVGIVSQPVLELQRQARRTIP